jgi:uncharacterized SAM-dependent methyltransferase
LETKLFGDICLIAELFAIGKRARVWHFNLWLKAIMEQSASILVHESRFPSAQMELWQDALGRKRLPMPFLYEGPQQAANWLALHHAFSPAAEDSNVRQLYASAYDACLNRIKTPVAHLAAICPGDASKERILIEKLRDAGKVVVFTSCDGSAELLLAAYESATRQFKGLQASCVWMDLEKCSSLPALLKPLEPAGAQRIATFFGTIHNLQPAKALSQVIKAVRTDDLLLLSANLAPEHHYDAALEGILAGYDNPLARNWFWGALNNLGISAEDGQLRIGMEPMPEFPALKRIYAELEFSRPTRIQAQGASVLLNKAERLQLFASCRFTAQVIRALLAEQNLALVDAWETGEEGVYLCSR